MALSDPVGTVANACVATVGIPILRSSFTNFTYTLRYKLNTQKC